ncbi:hypothetical protein [Streptomyces sp. NPDC020362]|uniref:hypothetical protein n=1 Tax=unclassified Streptomyces TaxID=2593676 RepID=UPI0033C63302
MATAVMTAIGNLDLNLLRAIEPSFPSGSGLCPNAARLRRTDEISMMPPCPGVPLPPGDLHDLE